MYACKTPQAQDPIKVEGAFIVNPESNLVPVTQPEVNKLVNENKNVNATPGPRIVSLRRIGDCETVTKGELFYADFEIDAAKATIESTIDQSTGDVSFCVISKKNKRTVVMKNLCDFVSIPSKDVFIEVKDEYNTVKDNKPYKIIVVPTFGEKCEVNGYVVRFDTEGRKNKCPESKLVKQQERALDDCQKGTLSNGTGPCGKKTNCAEWRMFRICCP